MIEKKQGKKQEEKHEIKQGNQQNQLTIILAGVIILLAIVFGILAMSRSNNNSQGYVSQTVQPTSGRVNQKGVITKTNASDKNWRLTYDKPGAPASILILVINNETFCKKSGKPILCSQLQNGHLVEVSGNLENDMITAKEINLLDEIKVEAISVKSPQVEDEDKNVENNK